MLVHIPVFVFDHQGGFRQQLQLLFTSLHSYYATGNSTPLLVSTNERSCLTAIEHFRTHSGFGFQTELVDEAENQARFGYAREDCVPLDQRRMVLSKLHPLLRRLDSHILHVDYDTIFNRVIEPERFFHGHLTFWSSRSNRRAINTGVMAVDETGMAYLSDLILNERVLQTGEYKGASLRKDNDEYLIMDLYNKRRSRVLRHSSRKYCHCLAYELDRSRNWRSKARIIHFHWYKPMNCTVSEHGPDFHTEALFGRQLSRDLQARFNDDLYAAILLWRQHFQSACRYFPALADDRTPT